MTIEYRSDTLTLKLFGGTGTPEGTVEVVSWGTPVPNMKVVGKAVKADTRVLDILKGAKPCKDITFFELRDDVAAMVLVSVLTAEQLEEVNAWNYIHDEDNHLLVPFTVPALEADNTYSLVGALVTLDGVPAVRYGYVACAEPFTYAQWDRSDAPEGEEHGPRGQRIPDE
jgi:hypothetical protein